jgi:exonuclease VII small subunit
MEPSTYSLAELLRKWGRGELTLEQAMGHFIQHLTALTTRLTEVEKRLHTLEQPPGKAQ